MLDPAVHREFQRLHHDAESKAQEIKQLKDELKAVAFSQESKAGRLLMAKCRTLQVSLVDTADAGGIWHLDQKKPIWKLHK